MVGDFFEDDAGGDDKERNKHREEHIKRQKEVNDFIISFAKANEHQKPLVVTINTYGGELYSASAAVRTRQAFNLAGVPAYASPECAAKALSRYIQYYEFQERVSAEGTG